MKLHRPIIAALFVVLTLHVNAGVCYHDGYRLVCEPSYYTVITSAADLQQRDGSPLSGEPDACLYPVGTKIFTLYDPESPFAVAWYAVPPGDDLTAPPEGFDPTPHILYPWRRCTWSRGD